MKLFTRSLLLLFVVCSLFFISCEDENNDPEKPSKPLLATMTHYRADGTLEGTESYRYDTQSRLIEMNTGDDYKVVLEYSPSMITSKEYDEGELDYTTVFNIDAKGLCISSQSDDDGTITYTYDANAYRKNTVEQHGNSTYIETYTVSNQNYVTITSEDKYITWEASGMGKSGSLDKNLLMRQLNKSRGTQNRLRSASDLISTYKTDYSFYTDKTNTIDIENMGIYFLGKQNRNPVRQEIETSSEGPEGTIDYTYEYDAKGRITKKTYSFGDYEIYTYVD